MTHHEGEATAIERVFEVMSEQGLEGMAEAMQTLPNEVMKLERSGSMPRPRRSPSRVIWHSDSIRLRSPMWSARSLRVTTYGHCDEDSWSPSSRGCVMPRIPDVDRSMLSPEDRDALGALPDLALFRMLAHAPEVMRPWLGLGGAFLASLELPARQRELAILAVARASECEYEWVQHEAIALLSGVTAEEISELKDGEFGEGLLGSVDAAVVRLATEAVHSVEVSADTIATVRSGLGPRQTVELLCLVGFATAIVAKSTDITVDAPAQLAVVEASERIARGTPT